MSRWSTDENTSGAEVLSNEGASNEQTFPVQFDSLLLRTARNILLLALHLHSTGTMHHLTREV